MKRFLESLKYFFSVIKEFFTPNEVFFKLVLKYRKEIIKDYYKELLDRFFSQFKSISF